LKEALFFGHGIQAFWLKWNVTHLGEAVYSGLGGEGLCQTYGKRFRQALKSACLCLEVKVSMR
jgi:hypothetical protein